MSVPERLWRLAKGYLSEAGERLLGPEHLQSEADAYSELADCLRRPAPPAPEVDLTSPPERPLRRTSSRSVAEAAPAGVSPSTGRDPLDACYALLGVEPGCELPEVDRAYAARQAELTPEEAQPGSAERAHREARRAALSAAYERLRDALNPTETRFEHIEF